MRNNLDLRYHRKGYPPTESLHKVHAQNAKLLGPSFDPKGVGGGLDGLNDRAIIILAFAERAKPLNSSLIS